MIERRRRAPQWWVTEEEYGPEPSPLPGKARDLLPRSGPALGWLGDARLPHGLGVYPIMIEVVLARELAERPRSARLQPFRMTNDSCPPSRRGLASPSALSGDLSTAREIGPACSVREKAVTCGVRAILLIKIPSSTTPTPPPPAGSALLGDFTARNTPKLSHAKLTSLGPKVASTKAVKPLTPPRPPAGLVVSGAPRPLALCERGSDQSGGGKAWNGLELIAIRAVRRSPTHGCCQRSRRFSPFPVSREGDVYPFRCIRISAF